jgi:hypothetical protein
MSRCIQATVLQSMHMAFLIVSAVFARCEQG